MKRTKVDQHLQWVIQGVAGGQLSRKQVKIPLARSPAASAVPIAELPVQEEEIVFFFCPQKVATAHF